MSKDIMDRMKQIRADLMGEVRSFDVKGLGEDGGPLTIYVHPVTAAELKKIWSHTNRVDAAIESIVQRARDEQGERLFKDIEFDSFMRFWLPKYIIKVAMQINEDVNSMTYEGVIDAVGK